jgi:hypothetical protein
VVDIDIDNGFLDEPLVALERGGSLLRLRSSLNSALGLKSDFVGAIAMIHSSEKVYEEEDVAAKRHL